MSTLIACPLPDCRVRHRRQRKGDRDDELTSSAARFPERLLPGKVDYIGNSHQIFHTFVLVGAWFQYAALRGMVWGRAMALGQA